MYMYLLINDSCNRHDVKGTVGRLPHLVTQLFTKLLLTLLLVREGFLNSPYLVVPSNHEELGRHQQLLSEKVSHDLKAVRTAVYIVTKKEERGRSEDWSHPPENLLETD